MAATFVVSSQSDEGHYTCALCLCLWKNPRECRPCGHLYCESCITATGSKNCPECRVPIDSLIAPNRILVQLLEAVRGTCSKCSWAGTKSEFESRHLSAGCLTAPPAVAPAKAVPAPPTMMPPSSSSSAGGFSAGAAAGDETVNLADYGFARDEAEHILGVWKLMRDDRRRVDFETASRFARFMNYPSQHSDIAGLFALVEADVRGGSVDLPAMALWMSSQRRDARECYKTTRDIYMRALLLAQRFDIARSGYLTLLQAKQVADAFAGRALTPGEWLRAQDKLTAAAQRNRTSQTFFLLHDILTALTSDGPLPTVAPTPASPSGAGASSASPRQAPAAPQPSFGSPAGGSTPGSAMRGADSATAALHSRIRKMFEKYDRSALATLDSTLAAYAGDEENFLQLLTFQYGPEP